MQTNQTCLPRHHIPLLYALLCLTVVALLVSPHTTAAAQQPSPITMTIEAGFDGHYRVDQWFPVAVTISNDGPDIRGVVEWRTPFQHEERTFQHEIELPRGARKRVMFSVLTSNFARTGEVRLLDGSRVLARQQVQIEAIGLEQFVIGVLSNDKIVMNSLLAMEVNMQDGVVDVLHFEPEMIPEDAQMLAGLNVLFIHDTNTATDLSDAQRDVLRQWVQLGGQLVLSGGPTAEHTTAGLDELVPVRITGLEPNHSLASLATLARDPNNVPPESTISSVTVQPGAQALDDDTLIVEQRYGNGRIIFSAFDLAVLRGWNSEQELWERVLTAEPLFAPATAFRNNGGNMLRNVLQLPALRLPSLGILLLFIVVYVLAVGPINFLVLGRLKRVELAWITVPAIVLLFVVGTYGVGSLMRGQVTQVMHITVVQGFEGTQRGQATSFMGIFSPHRTFYTLQFPSEALISMPRFDTGSTNDAPLVWTDSGTELRDALVDVSSIRTFIVEQSVDTVPDIASTVARDGRSIIVDVQNNSSEPLTDALLVYGTNWKQIETLAPGDSEQIELKSNVGSFPGGVFDFEEQEDELFNHQQMLSSLFNPNQFDSGAFVVPAPDPNNFQQMPQGMPDNTRVYLLVWHDAPVIDMDLDRRVTEQATTLYVIELAP